MMGRLTFIWTDEEGLATIEYSFLLALLVVGAIATWTSFGGKLECGIRRVSHAFTVASHTR